MIMKDILAKPAAAAAAAVAAAGLLTAAQSAPGGTRSGTESFTLTTHSLGANPAYQAVAKGVFSAKGTMQATSGASNAPLKATFPGGTFMIDKEKPGKQSGTVNGSTCRASYTATGATYKISDGTGSYKGIAGGGTATVTFTGTLPKLSSGKCNESGNAVPVAGTTFTAVHASGPVTLP